MTEELLSVYMDEVIRKRHQAIFSPPTLLIMDSATCHKTAAVSRHKNITPILVPAGCTPLVQPLDVSINKPFKCKMREQWHAWINMPEEDHVLTASGKRKRVSKHWI